MGRSRKRKLSFWTVLFAPVVLIGGVVMAISVGRRAGKGRSMTTT